MTRITVKSRVGADGVLHLDLPVGQADADKEVQVTVEPITPTPVGKLHAFTARELLNSGLVGMWQERTDILDSQEFARQLRDRAQTRERRS